MGVSTDRSIRGQYSHAKLVTSELVMALGLGLIILYGPVRAEAQGQWVCGRTPYKFNYRFLFGKSLQLHENQEKRNLSWFVYFIDEFQVWKEDQEAKYSKYLFAWHGRFQISKMNSMTSLLQVEWTDIKQKLQFNFYNLLILVFNLQFFLF